jgi:hypothetical protein
MPGRGGIEDLGSSEEAVRRVIWIAMSTRPSLIDIPFRVSSCGMQYVTRRGFVIPFLSIARPRSRDAIFRSFEDTPLLRVPEPGTL